MIRLRDASLKDAAGILALNEESVAVTSPMDAARFKELFALSSHCIVAEKESAVMGFVLAMQKHAAYDNGNYDWFATRLNNFVYIDRIVIAKEARGDGIGSKLYDHVAHAAKQDGCLVMAAEINIVPPNEPSLTFHQKYGFVRLGEREPESGKIVSMQVKNL